MKKLYGLCCAVLLMCIMLSGCAAAQETVAEAESTTAEVVVCPAEEAEESTTAEAAGEMATEEAPSEENILAKEERVIGKEADEAEEEVESMEETTEEVVEEIVVTPFETARTMYATIALNVRKGPSTDYDVVDHLAMAQAAEVTGQAESGWYQIMLDGEAAFVSNKYMSETKVEVPAPAPVPVPAQPAQAAEPAQPTATVAPAGVIMVGDSRCVQMQAAVGGGGCSWICENSKEYTWFSETAIPKFDQYVGNGTKVVINMGVNDPEHYKQYAELVNVKAAEWAARGARTYFVSVNPVWENPYTTQEQVDTFNANVPGLLSGVTWIDTSSWLTTNGYRLVDGLHFDDPTSVNIFNLIMGSL